MAIAPLRESPPYVREQRRYTGARVRQILAQAKDHPRLTDWDRNFLAHFEELVERYHGYLEISERQAAVLLKIEDKTWRRKPGL